MRRLLLLSFLVITGASCKARPGGASSADASFALTPGSRDLPATKMDTRFVKIRTLLREAPENKARALKLYPLVKPVCTDETERNEFLEVAKWSTSFSSEENHLPTELAVDTIEHVATSCFRTEPDAALALLVGASKFIERTTRLDVIRARLLAARGDFVDALEASTKAMDAGSIHAMALTANIQAQMARDKTDAYRAGMLNEAIATVSKEPNENWLLIDLTAVLATHARLLSERAVWESGDAQKKTLLEAGGLYQRISVAPFIEATRTRALDNLCFDAAVLDNDDLCRRAAVESKNLGAARTAKLPITAAGYDTARLHAIQETKGHLETLPDGAVLLYVARGDESELLEWIRPAAALLRSINATKKVRWVVVDRTATPRGTAVVKRTLALANVTPELYIDAARETFAMPCVTAVLADRRTPQACPLAKREVLALTKLRPYGLAILVGRDLDGEIDDLQLYEMRSLLLSFRRSLSKKGANAWLKSVSDVRIFQSDP